MLVGDRWVEGDPTGMRAANPWMPERVSHVAARSIEELDGKRGKRRQLCHGAK